MRRSNGLALYRLQARSAALYFDLLYNEGHRSSGWGCAVQRKMISQYGNAAVCSARVFDRVVCNAPDDRPDVMVRCLAPGSGYSRSSGCSTSVGIRKVGYFSSCRRQMIGVKAKRPRFKQTINRDEGGMQSFRPVGFVQATTSLADATTTFGNSYMR
jgi:hypothetical protein